MKMESRGFNFYLRRERVVGCGEDEESMVGESIEKRKAEETGEWERREMRSVWE